MKVTAKFWNLAVTPWLTACDDMRNVCTYALPHLPCLELDWIFLKLWAKRVFLPLSLFFPTPCHCKQKLRTQNLKTLSSKESKTKAFHNWNAAGKVFEEGNCSCPRISQKTPESHLALNETDFPYLPNLANSQINIVLVIKGIKQNRNSVISNINAVQNYILW